MKTKLFSLFLSLFVSIGTIFADKVKIGDLYYNLDDANNTAEVTYENDAYPRWSTAITTANIPSSVKYSGKTYSVTTIGLYAFDHCRTLTSVTIPNSVTSIGNFAFMSCTGLTSVTIPNSVTNIGEGAFSGCTGLTSLIIGNSVKSVGDYAFSSCSNLESIVVNENNQVYDSRDNCNAIIETSTNKLIAGCKNTIIPASITTIGSYAFSGCTGLASVTIPNSVTRIESCAFSGCTGLSSITIPNSVTNIGSSAFRYCSGLTSVTIGDGITSIGQSAFSGCSKLENVICAAQNPPSIKNYIFNNCDYLANIYVPCGTLESYKTDDGWSEYADKIKYAPYPYTIIAKNGGVITTGTVTICDEDPSLVCTALPSRGFYFVQWADGNTENPRTFELTQGITIEAIFDYQRVGKCGKDSVLTWNFNPENMALEISGKGALSENYTYGTFIESLTIGNEVTLVGEDAFYRFNNLKNVIIGSSVKVLEKYAFYNCSSIETITCYGQRPPTVNDRALYGLDYSTIVYVPADYLNTYVMHDIWGLYDVRPLGATSAETTDLTVVPDETTATVTWPAVTGAATYELVIKDKNGNVICTLIFNANGQLTSIAFAPSRDKAPQQTQSAGFAFTVTGLDGGTAYDLTIDAKDNNGTTLSTKTVSFITNNPQGIEMTNDQLQITNKVIRDGQILILRGDNTYTLTGQQVK